MKFKILRILVLSVITLPVFVRDLGVSARVVTRSLRVALEGVKLTRTPGHVTLISEERPNFLSHNVSAGQNLLYFESP